MTGFETERRDERDLGLHDHWDDETPVYAPAPAPVPRVCGRRRPRPGGLRGFIVCPQPLDEWGLCAECDR